MPSFLSKDNACEPNSKWSHDCSPGSESSSSSRSNSSSTSCAWSSGGGGGGNGSSVRTSVSAERRFFLLPSTSRLISSKMSEANRFGGATRNKTPSLSSQ